MKLLEENIGVIFVTRLGGGFLDISKLQQKKKNVNWTSSRLKTFMLQKTLKK